MKIHIKSREDFKKSNQGHNTTNEFGKITIGM